MSKFLAQLFFFLNMHPYFCNMNNSAILITGASGMLGRQIVARLKKSTKRIYTLGRSDENDFSCNLSVETPDFGANHFDMVIHCAGTCEENEALELNHEGTRHLLEGLEKSAALPSQIIYISSYEVYSADAGNLIEETHPTWATTKTGQSKALGEEAVNSWGRKNNVAVTIIRPARMFGAGVSGPTLRLFNEVVHGRYVHIRGNDAKISLVSSPDAANAVIALIGIPGIYNLSDGKEHKFIDMVEAMSENDGALRRMTHLPAAWAAKIYKFFSALPIVHDSLDPEKLKIRSKTMTLSNKRIVDTTGLQFVDTLEFIRRRGKIKQ